MTSFCAPCTCCPLPSDAFYFLRGGVRDVMAHNGTCTTCRGSTAERRSLALSERQVPKRHIWILVPQASGPVPRSCNGQEIEDFAAHSEQHPHEYELLAVEDLGSGDEEGIRQHHDEDMKPKPSEHKLCISQDRRALPCTPFAGALDSASAPRFRGTGAEDDGLAASSQDPASDLEGQSKTQAERGKP